ncbi:MAG: Flp pilus assembly protein CpaB [Parvibaculaceae bacterium]
MSKMRLAVLGLAIGSAVLAAFVAKGFMGKKQPVQKVEINKVETVDVLVAAKDVKMGDKLASGTIAWQPWPKKSITLPMITSEEDPDARTKYEQARARVAIFEGEPIIDKKLVMPGETGFMSAILPKGMRAIAVTVNVETVAGGFILPNDRVDVILTQKVDDANSNQRNVSSEIILSNVRVLAIDQLFTQTEGEGDKQFKVADKTATLELDPRQAEVIAQSQSVGQLSLALRSIAENDGVKVEDDRPVLAGKYLGGRDTNEVTIIKYGKPSVVTSN